MREIKFSYIYQHDDTERILNKKFDIHEIELELMGECFIERYTLIARRQYTGLKDKNGIEIYEGDIVKTKNSLYKVIYDKCCFWGIDEMGKYPIYQIKHYIMEDEIFEVIGNIYENPELLEGEI